MPDYETRDLVLYVTIDPWDHRLRDDKGGHMPNFSRLCQVAQGWRSEIEVEDLWMTDLTDERLSDPSLLAIFLSGSFTEWYEVFRQTVWQEQLDRLCETIRTTNVPILAVCGSHQLVARAYGGWRAIGHMSENGQAPIPISSEADGQFKAPDPRPSEIGVYGFHRLNTNISGATDPLLEGLPDAAYFVEYHRDEVLRVPKGTVFLLSPSFPQGISPFQALRYTTAPAGRILYTVQFHPELEWWEPDPNAEVASQNGARLIENFLSIAQKYRHD